MSNYLCSREMHNVCSNNALCHLCDGIRLFKDPVAEKQEKLRQREENKRLKKISPFKVYEKEKKEGMGFEKKVAKQWNDRMRIKPAKAVAKPRLGLSTEAKALPPQTFPVQAKPVFEQAEAQRQPNSGAGWAAKGDIKLEHALMECKERGTVNARGEKQITIPKLWITKQEQEAFQEQRPYWYIPFGYKGDEEVYLVKSYNHEMEMIFEMRQQQQRIEELERELTDIRAQEND